MNLQGNSGHVDGYGKHAVCARRRSSALRDSACRPDASWRRASLEETSARPETVFSRSDEQGVSFPCTRCKRRDEKPRRRRPRKTTKRSLGVIFSHRQNDRSTILQPQCVPFFLQHMRATYIASCIRPTADGNGDGKADRQRKKFNGWENRRIWKTKERRER